MLEPKANHTHVIDRAGAGRAGGGPAEVEEAEADEEQEARHMARCPVELFVPGGRGGVPMPSSRARWRACFRILISHTQPFYRACTGILEACG